MAVALVVDFYRLNSCRYAVVPVDPKLNEPFKTRPQQDFYLYHLGACFCLYRSLLYLSICAITAEMFILEERFAYLHVGFD